MWGSVFASQQYSMPMSQLGQTRSCGPCRLNVRFARKRTRLTPLADLGRSAGQAPLYRLHAAGIAAAGDDAEIGASLLQRRQIDMRFGGLFLDVAHTLRSIREFVFQK